MTITGGEKASRSGNLWNVPKHELMVGLKMMFDEGEVEIAEGLRLRRDLVEELMQMGQDYRAERGHDDLAMALALAAWRSRGRPEVGERGSRIV